MKCEEKERRWRVFAEKSPMKKRNKLSPLHVFFRTLRSISLSLFLRFSSFPNSHSSLSFPNLPPWKSTTVTTPTTTTTTMTKTFSPPPAPFLLLVKSIPTATSYVTPIKKVITTVNDSIASTISLKSPRSFPVAVSPAIRMKSFTLTLPPPIPRRSLSPEIPAILMII